MRKFLSIILALSIVFSLSAMVVSADSYVYELGTPTEVNDTTVTIPVIFNPPISMYAVDVVKVAFTLNGCTLKNVESKIPGYSPTYGATAFNLTGATEGALYDEFMAGDHVVAVVTIEKVTDNATIVIDANNSNTGDSIDGTFGPGSSVSPALTLWAAAAPEPEKPVSVSTTYTTSAGKEYTNVPNATVSGSVVEGELSITKILVNYWKDGEKVDTAKEFTNFTKPTFTGNGTVDFKVAIMGVPANVIVTSITAE